MIQCEVHHTKYEKEVKQICESYRNNSHIRVIQIHICSTAPTFCDTYYHIFIEFENI